MCWELGFFGPDALRPGKKARTFDFARVSAQRIMNSFTVQVPFVINPMNITSLKDLW